MGAAVPVIKGRVPVLPNSAQKPTLRFIFLTPNQPGDASLRLARELDRLGHRVTVATGLAGLLGAGRADYLLVESPPLLLGVIGFLFSRLSAIPTIYAVFEIGTASAKNSLRIRVARWLERLLYRHAAYVSAATENIVRHVAATGAIAPERVLRFPDGVDLDRFSPVAEDPALRHRLGLEGKAVFLVPGSIGESQAHEVIVEAADLLRDQEDIAFLLMGDGPQKDSLAEDVRGRSLHNVVFADPLPDERIRDVFAMARAVVVPQSAPSINVLSAFAARVPVIFVGAGETEDLIEESGGGVVVPPEDSGGLAMAVEFLTRIQDFEWRNMADAGFEFAHTRLRLDVLVKAWLQALS